MVGSGGFATRFVQINEEVAQIQIRKHPQQSSKSPTPKPRHKSTRPVAARRTAAIRKDRRSQTAATKLPTAMERYTLLTPLWVAESVVQEVERFLQAELPENFAGRLAAKAHYLYPRHKHLKKV